MEIETVGRCYNGSPSELLESLQYNRLIQTICSEKIKMPIDESLQYQSIDSKDLHWEDKDADADADFFKGLAMRWARGRRWRFAVDTEHSEGMRTFETKEGDGRFSLGTQRKRG